MAALLQRKLAAIRLTSVGKRFTWTDERKPFSSKRRCPELDNLPFCDSAYGRDVRGSLAGEAQLAGQGSSLPRLITAGCEFSALGDAENLSSGFFPGPGLQRRGLTTKMMLFGASSRLF